MLVNRRDASGRCSRPGLPLAPPAGRAGAPRRRFGAGAARCALAAALALLLSGAAHAATEVDELAGKPIAAIEFQGLRTLSEETLRYYLGLEVGAPFDPIGLDKNLHALWDLSLIHI